MTSMASQPSLSKQQNYPHNKSIQFKKHIIQITNKKIIHITKPSMLLTLLQKSVWTPEHKQTAAAHAMSYLDGHEVRVDVQPWVEAEVVYEELRVRDGQKVIHLLDGAQASPACGPVDDALPAPGPHLVDLPETEGELQPMTAENALERERLVPPYYIFLTEVC